MHGVSLKAVRRVSSDGGARGAAITEDSTVLRGGRGAGGRVAVDRSGRWSVVSCRRIAEEPAIWIYYKRKRKNLRVK